MEEEQRDTRPPRDVSHVMAVDVEAVHRLLLARGQGRLQETLPARLAHEETPA
jgi:hypothetical protein